MNSTHILNALRWRSILSTSSTSFYWTGLALVCEKSINSSAHYLGGWLLSPSVLDIVTEYHRRGGLKNKHLSRSECPQIWCLLRACFLAGRQHLLTGSSHGPDSRARTKLSPIPSYKGTNLIMRMPTSWTNYILQALPPNISMWDITLQSMNLGGTQTFHPQQSPPTFLSVTLQTEHQCVVRVFRGWHYSSYGFDFMKDPSTYLHMTITCSFV